MQDAAAIGVHRRHRLDRARQRDLLGRRARLDRIDAVADDLREVEVLLLEHHVPGLQACDEEQVVHEPEQPVRVPCDHVQVLAHVVGQVLLERELDVARDRRQRRTQVV